MFKVGDIVHVGKPTLNWSFGNNKSYYDYWSKRYRKEFVISIRDTVDDNSRPIYYSAWGRHDNWGLLESDILENQEVLTEEDML